jgi:hypothetical protein
MGQPYPNGVNLWLMLAWEDVLTFRTNQPLRNEVW